MMPLLGDVALEARNVRGSQAVSGEPALLEQSRRIGQRNERITCCEPVGCGRGEVDPERSRRSVLFIPGRGPDIIRRDVVAQLLAEICKEQTRSDEGRGDEETSRMQPP